ncbi:amidohydrolase family protein [Acidianus sulfidivorans JP7]|uniref:N-ethylammeline chlorohydrolase n=1 Tax=Acidianus sulfidivorans JP7 TaxID=619593 RepID=A0A2U9IME0_9CREN|nr:amidohydrolase family protein [Acidianus sulfidivorans]AWR97183.1 amidohydrolase family protein [Acidianus sulfidivorans JP7]
MDEITINVRTALLDDELNIENSVHIEINNDGIIQHIGKGYTSNGKTLTFDNGILLPAYSNSHVHTADFSFPEFGIKNTIKELVGDPNSIKYQLFSEIEENKLLENIENFIKLSASFGVNTLLDFREQGLKGSILASKIKAIYKDRINYYILGRLEKTEINKNNLEILSKIADGYGISSISSYTIEELKMIRKYFDNKIIAIHVSETLKQNLQNDLEYAIEYLKPKIIVHGTNLSTDEILEAKEKNIYLVICPRSNLWFSSGIPKISEIVKDEYNKILIGTDNGAWINPNIMEDAELALLLSRLQDPLSNYSKEILKAITLNAREFGIKPIAEGEKAIFNIIEGENSGIFRAKDKYAAIIKRGKKILFTYEELSKMLK